MKRRICWLAGATAILSPVVHADVRVTEKIELQGSGMMSLAGMNGTTVTSIAGRSARIENDITMQSRFARMFAKDAGQTVEVVRLEDDVVLQIEPKKKQYRQTSMTARRAQLEQAASHMREAQARQPMGGGLDDSQCEWGPAKSSVKKPGTAGSFAGVAATETVVTVTQPCKLRSSGALCEVSMVSDVWLAPKFSGDSEVLEFRRAYAQQLGLATGSGTFGQQAQSLLSRYPQAWTLLADEMGKMKGSPMKTTFTLSLEGAGCGSGGAPAGAGENPVAAVGQIMSGLFGRKGASSDGAAVASAAKDSSAASGSVGDNVVLRISSEVTGLDTAMLGAETFQAPGGFRKIDP